MHRCLCLPVDWPQRSLLIAWRVDKSRDTLITVLSLAGAGAIFIWCAPLGRRRSLLSTWKRRRRFAKKRDGGLGRN